MSSRADHHELRGHAAPTESSSDRSFGLVFAGFFVILGAYSWWHQGRWWPAEIAIAAAFLAVALLRPNMLAPLNRMWTKLGLLMAMVVSPIVLGLLFSVVVTPVGLLMRLTGKDPLRLRDGSGARSYWIVRQPPGPAGETMGDQF
jgi:Saxitoxin biosynthesis operon protein SxtJ